MRALVALVVVALPAPARADDAQRDLIVEYKRLAAEAARAGNCDPARELADKVKAIDQAFFVTEYLEDPAIAACLPPPSPAAIAPVDQPAVPASAPPARPLTMPPPREIPLPPFQPSTPPLDPGRLVAEILVGGVMSLVGMLGGGLVGAVVCGDEGGEFGCLAQVLIGAYYGGAIAFGMGVYLIGNSDGQTGSLGWTVFGGVVGASAGFFSILAADGGDFNETVAVALLVGGPVVGSLIGFNSTRRWRDSKPPVGSLLRLDRQGLAFGIPLVIHTEQRGIPTTTVPILSGAF